MSDLSPESKLLIQNHVESTLVKWGALLGITNIVAIAAGIAYLFFLVPNQALKLIEAQIAAKMAVSAETLVQAGKAQQISNETFVQAGKARELLATVTKTADSIDSNLTELRTKLEKALKSDSAQLVELTSDTNWSFWL